MSEVGLVDRKSEMGNGKTEWRSQMARRCIPVIRGMLVTVAWTPVSCRSRQA